jgi:tetratricopeptide (TPR) repeat protein
VTPDPRWASEYDRILKRVQQGDMNVNFRTFRVAAALMTGKYGSQAEEEQRLKFKKLFDNADYQAALDSANEALKSNYACVSAHYNAILAILRLKRPKQEIAPHQAVLKGLLDSIEHSGDGTSLETAMFVVSIPEEYVFLATRAHAARIKQSLVRRDGHAYDDLQVQDFTTKQVRDIWFNTDYDLGLYKPPPPHTPEQDLDLKKAAQLFLRGEALSALPLFQSLSDNSPDDASVLGLLAQCLWFKSGTNVSPEESLALMQQAGKAAKRAWQLGDSTPATQSLLAKANAPNLTPRTFSTNSEADKSMKTGEQALGTGNLDAAIAAYSAALQSDPKLHAAADYIGNTYLRKNDADRAGEWFAKAAAMNPNDPAAYRDWGNGLLFTGHMEEARAKLVEALVTLPAPDCWNALAGWATKANYRIAPPRIDRPTVTTATEPAEDGRAAWANYSKVRASWHDSLFSQKYPAEKQYRHTLAEEADALNAVANAAASQNSAHLDPQLATLITLQKAGLLEAWILINGGDAGIVRDYASYRDTHRDQLRTYVERYVIQPAQGQ